MTSLESYAARFLQCLEAHRIAYAVTGPGRLRPEHPDDDLDIVVPPDAVPRLGPLVSWFCSDQGGQLANALHHAPGACCFVCVWNDVGRVSCLRLDISADCVRAGRLLLRAEEILEGRVREDPSGLPVPAPDREFVYLLLKKVEQQALTDSTAAHLEAQWRKDPAGCRTWLTRFWSGSDAAVLGRAAETGDWRPVRARLHRLRRALRGRVAPRWRYRGQGLARLAKRLLQPTGTVVAFLGPDGTGKTSVIERSVVGLASIFQRTVSHHFKPNLLGLTLPGQAPALGRLGRGPSPGWSPVSVGKLAYYLCDYWIGYAAKVWPRLVRTSLVLFDRYFDDLGIDPVRLRHRGCMALAGRLRRLVPGPELYILLDAPPGIIQARKREVSTEETARQRAAFLELLRGRRNAHVVDASRQLDDVAADVQRLVLDHLARRTARRLGVEPTFRRSDRPSPSPWIPASRSAK